MYAQDVCLFYTCAKSDLLEMEEVPYTYLSKPLDNLVTLKITSKIVSKNLSKTPDTVPQSFQVPALLGPLDAKYIQSQIQ